MKLLTFFFCIVCAITYSQETDTALYGILDVENKSLNLTVETECIGDYYYFFIYEYDEVDLQAKISVIKTDDTFTKIKQVDTLKMGRALLTNINFIGMADMDAQALMYFKKNEIDHNTFFIAKVDLNTFDLEVTDSIKLNSGESLQTFDIDLVDDTTFGTFGINVDPDNLSVLENYYMEVSKKGKIKRYETLDIVDPPRIISMCYIEENNQYFLASYFDDFLVIDSNLNVSQRIDKEFEYDYNGIGHRALIASHYCSANANYVNCVGEIFFGDIYSVSHVRFPIVNGDSVGEIDQVKPLFEENLMGTTESTLNAVDRNGDIIAVTNSNFDPFVDRIDTSTLYIQKINQEYENEWFFKFNNGSEFSIIDVTTDKNNDIIVVGSHWREEFYGDRRNFYLKINADGTLTSTGGNAPPDKMMVVYPNPTVGNLNIKDAINNLSRYTVYNSRGEKVKSADLQGTDNFSIRTLPAGTYFIHFMNKQGQPVKKAKVVKY